jgi:PhoD-like phosphatase
MPNSNKADANEIPRRRFLQAAAAVATTASVSAQSAAWTSVDDFARPNSLYHGDGWETLNPGYWKIHSGALRRKLVNRGDKNPTDHFPFHWESNQKKPIPIEVDPSLPEGMIWRRDWFVTGNYSIRAEFTIRANAPQSTAPQHLQDAAGYALMGLCLGGRTLYESRHGGAKEGNGAWMALWSDDGKFGLYDHAKRGPGPVDGVAPVDSPALEPGDRATIEITVSGGATATVTATLTAGGNSGTVTAQNVDRAKFTEGYIGLTARGLCDFEVNRVSIRPGENQPRRIALNECHICYPLGHTLRQLDSTWTCRFVALFRNDGQRAEIRIADIAEPAGGWSAVPVAGSARIVTNSFRRNTAIIEATLPANPADKTLYYTVWKDGQNVTADPRVDTPDMLAPGNGFIDPAPQTGAYVGRLPQLNAPYRVCGLGGHALHRGAPNLPDADNFEANWVHDQPTPGAYHHQEEFNFQIMAWDDDVWYLELLFCPPSTDDAYRCITNSIGGPTTRWQFMQHWNIVNPGDHDFGMDDIKGPEQYIIRNVDGLGQDMEYMRRNYQVVTHLTEAIENPSGTDNPKLWHHWPMPDGDFTLLVLDARRWRNSQDTEIWGPWGWGHKDNLYARQDPTRTLLGEEQFAWLQQIVRNDAAPLILMVGVNCMHTVFTGRDHDPVTGDRFAQRDRVAADYAGWVTAGCDRVIDLLGSRQGIVSVYGDIHLASIVENKANRMIECSFGPIGRSGSRGVKKGFGREMTDYEGRDVTVHALYHSAYGSPELEPRTGPKHWNFLEIALDPRPADPQIELRIRNIVDAPSTGFRGGGSINRPASQTGRRPSSQLPNVRTLPNASVHLATTLGEPVRGTRSLPDGAVILPALIDVVPGTQLILTAFDGSKTDSQLLHTEST